MKLDIEQFEQSIIESLKKRAKNRESSKQILINAGIEFEVKNNGAHLIIISASGLIDFWPGTGQWLTRNCVHGRGVKNLLHYIKHNK